MIDFKRTKAFAEQGDADAGEGVKQNDAEGLVWLRKTAEQGNAIAQNGWRHTMKKTIRFFIFSISYVVFVLYAYFLALDFVQYPIGRA